MTTKLLITSGCSFTDEEYYSLKKWPTQLSDYLNVPVINTAVRSQGNGIISRKVIYQVIESLKTTNASDMLVGIMWSGPDRHDFYLHNHDKNIKNHSDYAHTSLSPAASNKWIILNSHWENPYAKHYYSTFHDEIGSLIYTYEHILRVQWFLKLHKIRYFMTTYMNTVFYNPNKFFQNKISRQADTAHLYNQIDHDQFLPIDGQYEWAVNTGLPLASDNHPGTEHNQKFVNEVIIPFLERKNYI